MAIFDIDFPKLIKYTLPVRLRSTNMQAWLGALVTPVTYLYNQFRTNRRTNLYQLGHNGQVCYLQAALNDAFDDTLRRITITDAAHADAVYIYIVPELKPVPLNLASEHHPIPLYTQAEVQASTSGFVVNVPATVTFDTSYMKAIIDKYRLVSKNKYTINII